MPPEPRAGRPPAVSARHLTCLVAIARTGSLGRAAEQLHLSQPAVSKTLAELERLAGERLVDRDRNGARLTRSGERLLEHALTVTRALDAAAATLGRGGSPAAPLVRVAALPTVASALLPRTLVTLHQVRPDAVVTIRTADNPDVLAALRSGEADVALGRLAEPSMMRGLSFEPLYTESICAVTRPEHPLAGLRKSSIADVAGYRLVVPEAGTAPRQQVEAFLRVHGIELRGGTVETQSSSVAREVTLVSDAIWMTPRHLVRADLDRGWLVSLDLPLPRGTEPIGMMVRHSDELHPTARELVELLRDQSDTERR